LGFRSREFNSAVTLGQTAFATIHVTVASSPCWALAVVCLAKPSNLPAISREFINPLGVAAASRKSDTIGSWQLPDLSGTSRVLLLRPGASQGRVEGRVRGGGAWAHPRPPRAVRSAPRELFGLPGASRVSLGFPGSSLCFLGFSVKGGGGVRGGGAWAPPRPPRAVRSAPGELFGRPGASRAQNKFRGYDSTRGNHEDLQCQTEGPGLKTTPGGLKVSILMSAGLLRTPRAQNRPNRPRGFKSIDFDVSGLALEGPELKTRPGELKASILTSAGLLWRAPSSKQAPGS
jgi:hypothetical protein